MKLLIFAHVPPPYHGQSIMVKQLVDRLAFDDGSRSIRVWHVNARFSTDIADVGRFRIGKLWELLGYCLTARRLQKAYGIDTILYVPAPAQRTPLLRDWLVMMILRRRFACLVLYWQAAGLGVWLKHDAGKFVRAVSCRLLGKPEISVVLGKNLAEDAEAIDSRSVVVVPNFMPDPTTSVDLGGVLNERDMRRARVGRIFRKENADGVAVSNAEQEPVTWRLLFMSLCSRTKGLFDTLDAVGFLNADLRRKGLELRVELTVAGKFPSLKVEREFEERIERPDLTAGGRRLVRHLGFVGGEDKSDLFIQADCLCFPTYFPPEAFPTVVVEAMAWGLPVVTTRWRAVPELLPEGYPLFVAPQAPQEIVDALRRSLDHALGHVLRQRFLSEFHADKGISRLRHALLAGRAKSRNRGREHG